MKNQNKNRIGVSLSAFFLAAGFFFFAFEAQAADPIQKGIIDQVNQERAKRGLEQLQENETLNQAAGLKARDMIGRNYFSHTSPAGIDPWYWLEEVGYQYKYAGENLAMDFSSATSVHRAWMNSESHKENILSDKYQEIGVAVLDGIVEDKETKVAVQFFGTALKKEQAEKVSQILEKFDTGMTIEEASVRPWQETGNDEMLIYARVEGEIKSVQALIGEKKFDLEKLGESKYMNLISLGDVDLGGHEITVKAETEDGQAVFYQIPKYQYAAYVEQKDKDDNQLATAIAQVKSSNQMLKEKTLNSQSLILFGFMIVCLIMIANVWILEKEEERLIEKVAGETV